MKRAEIYSLIESDDVYVVRGVIGEVGRGNGSDYIYVDDRKIEIPYDDIYCLSGKEVFSKNDSVSITYVRLEGLLSLFPELCIINYEFNHKVEDHLYKSGGRGNLSSK